MQYGKSVMSFERMSEKLHGNLYLMCVLMYSDLFTIAKGRKLEEKSGRAPLVFLPLRGNYIGKIPIFSVLGAVNPHP